MAEEMQVTQEEEYQKIAIGAERYSTICYYLYLLKRIYTGQNDVLDWQKFIKCVERWVSYLTEAFRGNPGE